ncbi:MAG: SDR family NAD(P)-dependent oxidoreductase [SAR324 cluster bacterium]|nr:SDR family NAD(P)-dependent oxidoreductase [SAR324 cluster bacterium]
MQRYAGKNVLISGGGSGIGHAICLRLAAEGANIILIDKDLKGGQSVEQELKLQNTKVLFVNFLYAPRPGHLTVYGPSEGAAMAGWGQCNM